MTGNFDPENFEFNDFDDAIKATHDLEIPVPPLMRMGLMAEVLIGLVAANPDKEDEFDHFKSTIGWGIAIGVMAERNRVKRNS